MASVHCPVTGNYKTKESIFISDSLLHVLSSCFTRIFSTACKVMQQRCSFKRVRPSGSWIPAAADLAICFRCLVTKPGPHHPRRQNEIQCPLPETLLITPYQLAPSLLIDASQVVEPITTHLAVDCPLAASLVSSCSLAHGL